MNQNMYRDFLKQVHATSIDNWFDEVPEEEGVGDDLLEFLRVEVWLDGRTNKWRFRQDSFKREGQARKAATKFFHKKF